jgi:D-alanyl-D-alanine carboxypeptidase
VPILPFLPLPRAAVRRTLIWAALAVAASGLTGTQAAAEALLLVEAESGKVLFAHNAGQPWYPASVTKLMTTYVTLRAVKEGRITLDTTVKVSSNAAAQAPVKMGFPVGTLVTVDNALKMLLVRSSNDMAVLLAEGVAGSMENFADQMNRAARRLGMTQSSFVNPNGLPADDQITSARDLAILARALIHEFPEYDSYWHIPAIRMGRRVQRNYNSLIGRYPGADGMKTGFICASGFNLVASATRDGRRLIAVVLGASSSSARTMTAAQLLERGFNNDKNPLSWLMPSLGTVDTIEPVNATPPNLRDEMCGKHRKRKASEDEDDDKADGNSSYAVFLAGLPKAGNGTALLTGEGGGAPVVVYTGPARKPGELQAAEKERPSKHAGKKSRHRRGKHTASADGGTAASANDAEGASASKPRSKKRAAHKRRRTSSVAAESRRSQAR